MALPTPLLASRRPEENTQAALEKFQMTEEGPGMAGKWAVDANFSYDFGAEYGHAGQGSVPLGRASKDILDALLLKKHSEAEAKHRSGAADPVTLRILDVGAGKGLWLAATAEQIREGLAAWGAPGASVSTAHHGVTGGGASRGRCCHFKLSFYIYTIIDSHWRSFLRI
jgi:hypothetical protein